MSGSVLVSRQIPSRLMTRTGPLNYLPRQFFSFRGRSSGTLLYRGYSAASAVKTNASGTGSRSASNSRRPSSNAPRPDKPEPPSGPSVSGVRARSASVFEDIKEGADKLGKEGIEKLSGKDKKSAMQEEMAPLVSLLMDRGRVADEPGRR